MMKPKPYRTDPNQRHWNRLTKVFVWLLLAIFIATSVGFALVVSAPH
jgi:hypothetical protein